MFVGDLLQCLKVLHCPGIAHPTGQSPPDGPPAAVALELGGDGGAVAMELGGDSGAVDGSTAEELQAVAARMTEIPTTASFIRDEVSPKIEISSSSTRPGRSGLCLRWALPTSRLTLALAVKFPILRLANAGRLPHQDHPFGWL